MQVITTYAIQNMADLHIVKWLVTTHEGWGPHITVKLLLIFKKCRHQLREGQRLNMKIGMKEFLRVWIYVVMPPFV